MLPGRLCNQDENLLTCVLAAAGTSAREPDQIRILRFVCWLLKLDALRNQINTTMGTYVKAISYVNHYTHIDQMRDENRDFCFGCYR